MAIEPVNVGTAPNTGNGDPLRPAFQKLNQSDSEINAKVLASGIHPLSNVTGSADAITADLPEGIVAANGMKFIFTPVLTNAGPATLTFGGTTYSIQNGTTALAGGELLAESPVTVSRITDSTLRLVGATAGQNRSLSTRISALEPVIRTVTNADGATNRNTATYLTPGMDVTFNPNGEGGLIEKSPPINGNATLVNAKMSVRRRGNAIVQTMFMSDGKIYDKSWLDGAEGQWLEVVSAAALGAETARAIAREVELGTLIEAYGEDFTSKFNALGSGGDAMGVIVLIAYEDNRMAIWQQKSGVDFIPADELIERIAPGMNTRIDGVNFEPIIMYEDERMAIWQTPSGVDFIPADELIARFPIPEVNRLQRTKVQINSVNGQSHSTGGPWDIKMTNAYAATFQNEALLQIIGMRRTDGAAADSTAGPSLYGYDHAFPATGISQGEAGANNIGLPFAAYATLNAHRADVGQPQIPVLTCGHGIGGIPLVDMDDDPDTGSGNVTVWDNFTWWTQQAKAQAEAAGLEIVQGWHLFNHGGAGSRFPHGQYLSEWEALQKKYLAHWTSIGLTQPRYIITQTGGGARTDNAGPGYWAVADDQLDLVERGDAVLGSCDYWYPIYDGNVHWDAYGTSLAGETLAWAMSEVEAGRKWSIHRPKVVANTAGRLTLSFDSLRDDEHLQIEDATKYGGIGIDAFLGFELVGGTITGVDIQGRRVTITHTGTPTLLKYARQIGDLTGSNYTAHRGLLRTSLRKRSKFWPDMLMVRPIPTFTMEL